MKALLDSAFAYTAVGLLSGVYYREMTRSQDYEGFTQLSVVHTHLLALGTIFLLIVAVCEWLFGLSGRPQYRWFLGTFHSGLIVTVAMLLVHGTMQVYDKGDPAAISGIAGLGHILLAVALVLFFVMLRGAVATAPRPWARAVTVSTDDGTEEDER